VLSRIRTFVPSLRSRLGSLSLPWAERLGSVVRRPLVRRVAGMVAVVLVGAWLGVLAAGHVHAPIGPVQTHLSVRATWTGDTWVDVGPLGSLRLDSHDGPIGLNVDVEQLDVSDARRLLEDPPRLRDLRAWILDDLRSALIQLGLRSVLAAVAGAAILGALIFRRDLRSISMTGGLAGGVALALIGAAGLTWNPRSVSEPQYTGLLVNAPSIVGNARNIVANFSSYSEELAKLVTNVSRLYDVTSGLPASTPDPTTIRVLHVADIHLNPAAWGVIRSIVEQFQVAAIVDAGDLTDHGSRAEARFVDRIEDLRVPYVYVRGNHDSAAIEAAVRRQRNAVVLDGKVVEVAGLRWLGAGDPRFTPDRSVEVPGSEKVREMGARLAGVAAAADPPADVAVVHDPTAAAPLDGLARLVLAGHTHRRRTEVLPLGTRLFVQGSTGGAGLRALERDPPTPIACSVLYFDQQTKRLQAWDDVTLGGYGLASAEITRHLASEVEASPTPSPGATTESPGATPGSTPGAPAVLGTPGAPPAAGPPGLQGAQPAPVGTR
jgi:predicted MPP superfamily phosphohydrolase